MVLVFWWLALVLLPLAVLAVWLFSKPGSMSTGSTPSAHLDRLTALPAFRTRRRNVLLVGTAVVAVLGLSAGTALVGIARPATIQTLSPERKLRDVMLCLDASGSMITYDAEIIDSYLEMIGSFDGERIGMTVFNSSAVSVFPLTDDYDMATEFLEDAKRGFETGGMDGTNLYAGTSTETAAGSSLIGDGLTSCIDNFDKDEEDRSRSIVLATDNELAGTPIFTLQEATDIAVDEKIPVYTLAPRSLLGAGPQRELERTAQRTGGQHFRLGATAATDTIVDAISEQEAKKTEGRSYTVIHDHPTVWLVLTALGLVAVLVLAWRFKL